MEWRDREGNVISRDEGQDKSLTRLYSSKMGRICVALMVRPWVSRVAGCFMDSRLSRVAISRFIKKNHIDMSEYEDRKFRSFNDCFTRKIREGKRVIDMEESHLISPCDSKLTVYPITQDARFNVKGTDYTLESLLRSNALAQRYEGGTLLIFRLTVDDYHRYCYPDNGVKGENIHLQGIYHTVNPVANEYYPIYKENTREYTILQSENFGPMLMMEVGATMVGRIVNNHKSARVYRGREKGRFEFGGSTIILCLEKDRVQIDADIVANTEDGEETVVKMGEKIGIQI